MDSRSPIGVEDKLRGSDGPGDFFSRPSHLIHATISVHNNNGLGSNLDHDLCCN